MRRVVITLLALAMLGAPQPVLANKDDSPLKGEVSLELQSDWAFRSDDRNEERTDTFATVETKLSLRMGPGLTLKSLLVFEPALDPGPGEDRFFGDMGVFAEELYGEYERGDFTFRFGKFGQKFGIAWDVAPGIWGGDFADYELNEQIGIAAEYRFGGTDLGKHGITVGTFFTDTTVLSDSLINSRGRTRKSDGGPGNTEDFSSLTLVLEGSEIPALPGIGYHLAYLYRDSDAPGETAETGFAAGLTHAFKQGETKITSLLEWARLYDHESAPGQDADFLSAAVEFSRGAWSLVASWTGRWTDAPGAGRQDDHFTEISSGYEFVSGIKISAGWRHIEESGITTDTLGVFFEYGFKI